MAVQELSDHNTSNRKSFSEQFLEIMDDGELISCLLMTHKAHFHLTGYINKQNFYYWAEENPRQLHQRPLHIEKVTVWCAVASFGVIGPYFFEDDEGIAVTVTSDRYTKML
jgi:hypothetical protein